MSLSPFGQMKSLSLYWYGHTGSPLQVEVTKVLLTNFLLHFTLFCGNHAQINWPAGTADVEVKVLLVRTLSYQKFLLLLFNPGVAQNVALHALRAA